MPMLVGWRVPRGEGCVWPTAWDGQENQLIRGGGALWHPVRRRGLAGGEELTVPVRELGQGEEFGEEGWAPRYFLWPAGACTGLQGGPELGLSPLPPVFSQL